MKKTLFSSVLHLTFGATFLLTAEVRAASFGSASGAFGDIGSTLSGLFSGSGGSLSTPPIFGDTSVSLQCNPSVGSLDIPSLDICKATGMLDKITGNKIAFKIGPCDISGQNPLSCNTAALKDYCNARAEKPIREVVADVRRGERNAIDAGRSKVAIVGGDQYAKKTLCDNMSDTLTQFPEAKKARDNVTKLSGTPAYGVITNTRFYKDSSQSYEALLKSGKSESEAARFSTPYSIGSSTSGASTSDVEIASINTARETLRDPLHNAASSSFNDEADLRKKISSKCGDKTSVSDIENCSADVINNDYNMKQKIQNTEADIESKEAARMALFDDATAHRRSITHPTQAYMDTLPIQLRNTYSSTAKKAMAQNALIASFNKRISEAKKELLLLMMQKTELAAKPFYEKAEAEKVKKDLKNAGAY